MPTKRKPRKPALKANVQPDTKRAKSEPVVEKERTIVRKWNVPQSRFLRVTPDQARYVDFEGAIRCISPWTRVQTTDRGSVPISELIGVSSFDVLSWDGSSQCSRRASDVHLKGIEPAFRVYLDNGNWFDATLGHRVLSSEGYVSLGRIILSVNGLRCWRISPDSGASCAEDGRRGDGQSRLVTTAYLRQLLQPNDVLRLFPPFSLADVEAPISRCSRVYPDDGRFSMMGAESLSALLRDYFVDPTRTLDSEWCAETRVAFSQFARERVPRLTGEEVSSDLEQVGVVDLVWGSEGHVDCTMQQDSCTEVRDVLRSQTSDLPERDWLQFLSAAFGSACVFPSSHLSLAGGSRIQCIIPIGLTPIIDFEVDGTGCYYSAGLIHHNSGKTTPLVWAIINYAINYPGIKMMLCRWTGDALDMQLKPKFYEECPREILGRWNAKEEYQEFTNGSLVYLRSLKSSDDAARYSKFAGLTLAVIGVDQPEELPWDIFSALKGRLSQPGYPQQLLLTPNPPAPDHWLAKEFPEDNHVEGHFYLCTSVYDNREVLGDNYIRELEKDYPPGHVLRRRFIEGRRGLSIEGEGVYKHAFSRELHVREIEFLADFPLIESWDFGQKHPAVSWHQITNWGWWNVLGEYMGDSEFIDTTVPAVAALRAELFPSATTLLVCCDPAGADKQGHGIRHTAVDVLNTHLRQVYGPQVGARFVTGSNLPEKRQFAIQQISSYMNRIVRGRPALLCHPRCEVIVDGFEAGYVYDDRAFTNARLPNFRRPKKDGYYDHLQNTCEYVMLNYGVGPIEAQDISQLSYRERMRRLQQDSDLDDYVGAPTRSRGRVNY